MAARTKKKETARGKQGVDIALGNPLAASEAKLARGGKAGAGKGVLPKETAGGAETEYGKAIARGKELIAKPLELGGPARILAQHAKGRMTVLERLRMLSEIEKAVTSPVDLDHSSK